MVELLASKRTVAVAVEMGVQKWVLESDSQVVVNKLKAKNHDLSAYGPLVDEMKVLVLTIENPSNHRGA